LSFFLSFVLFLFVFFFFFLLCWVGVVLVVAGYTGAQACCGSALATTRDAGPRTITPVAAAPPGPVAGCSPGLPGH